jgi:hypothetical protein
VNSLSVESGELCVCVCGNDMGVFLLQTEFWVSLFLGLLSRNE